MSVVALNNLQDITITTKGKEILGKIISGEDYTIYKAKIGTGTLPSTEKEEDQTDLITEYKEIVINNVTVLDGGGYQIEVVYDNLGVTALTDITELGIYMADASNGETLYAYSYSATPLVLIPESKGVVEITNRINVYLVDGDTVNAHIDRTGTYVTIDDLEQKLKLKMDVSAAGSGFGLHKSDAIDSDDSDTVATSKAVHDVNVKVDADKKILTSTTTTANNAVANAKTALDTANTKMTQTQGDARYPLITDDWKDTNAKILDCTTISDPDTWAKTAEYGEYRLYSYNTTWSKNNKWPDIYGSETRLRIIKTYGLPTYRTIELLGYDSVAPYRVRTLVANIWEEWINYYSNTNKPTKADVGLGSVGNHGITDSTTANSSSTYASSKAVTTVHNEAVAASTAAAKAQTTADSKITQATADNRYFGVYGPVNPSWDAIMVSGTGSGLYGFAQENAITSPGPVGAYPYGIIHQYHNSIGGAKLQIYSSHHSSDSDALYFRSGYKADKRPWAKIYSTNHKPTSADIGLGSVHNYGITDSTTANSSITYASSKAVTTVHNEAVAASTAAAKAQSTANAAIPKTERWIKDYKVIGQTTTPLALTTFRETGNYKSVASANKWSDLPSGADSAFTMIVDSIFGLNSSGYLKQTLSSYNTNATWVRVDTGNGTVNWGAWSKIYSEHSKPTAADVGALPATGGTVTGNITIHATHPALIIHSSTRTDMGIYIQEAPDNDGDLMYIQSAGTMILGSGEYPVSRASLIPEPNRSNENLYLGSDSNIYFETNAQAIGSRHTFTLDIAGNMSVPGKVTEHSDRTLKENIRPIEDIKDKIAKLELVRYDRIKTGTSEIGVIAQDVRELFPEVVVEDKNGILSVDYSKLAVIIALGNR